MKKTMCKRLSSISVAIGLAFTLGACKPKTPVEPTAPVEIETTTSTEPEETKPKTLIQPQVFNVNKFSDTLPFELPKGIKLVDERYSEYTSTKEPYEELLSQLTAHGYKHHKTRYSDYLFKDDCMINISFHCVRSKRFENGEDSYSISVIRKTPIVFPDGITYEEVASRFPCGEDSLSPLPVHPIDITPEGVYESTGGQIFAVPVYSYDEFTQTGETDLMFLYDDGEKANEDYSTYVYYINGDDMVLLSMGTFAVADIDEDGDKDLLTMNYGPTSGFFTITLQCITNHGIYRSGWLYDNTLRLASGYTGHTFTVNDGKVKIGDCWDVILKDTPDGKYVILDCDGQKYSGGLGWIDEPSENDVPDRE